MVLPACDCTLYVVTHRGCLKGECLEDKVQEAISGGATMVQLREKYLSTRDFLDTAHRVKVVADKHGIPLIINDRLDIALAVDASGLHCGQDDMPAATARRLLGKGKILGVSVTNKDEALQAERDGADYLGAGAVFPTDTKSDAGYVAAGELRSICSSVGIPVVAIGGINENNALLLKGAGIKGIAVVSAVFGKEDVKGAARIMKNLAEDLLRGVDS